MVTRAVRKKKPPQKAPRPLAWSIQIRLSTVDTMGIQADLDRVCQESGFSVKPGAYARGAVIAYARHRKMEAGIRNIRMRAHDLTALQLCGMLDNLLTEARK